MRKSLLDPLETQCIEFPEIIIKGSEIQIPFQALLKIESIGEAVLSAKGPKMLIFNLYDDWRKMYQSSTCFNRTLLLLRAIHTNSVVSSKIIKEFAYGQNQESVWPAVKNEDWSQLEIEL